jgi:hypothetical protein
LAAPLTKTTNYIVLLDCNKTTNLARQRRRLK